MKRKKNFTNWISPERCRSCGAVCCRISRRTSTIRNTANWNATRSEIFELTHEPVRDFIQAHQNQRFGIVYFDFVPGKDDEGNPRFLFDVSTTYSLYFGFYCLLQEFSTEINNAIIERTFKRKLRTSSGN